MIKYFTVLCLLGAFSADSTPAMVTHGPGWCQEWDTDYSGTNINNGLETFTNMAYDCQVLCQTTDGCNFWSWVDGSIPHPDWRNSCWLKSEVTAKKHIQYFKSGPKWCPPETTTASTARPGCHDGYIFLGGPNLEFADQFGYFKRHKDTSYKQLQGDHILKYQAWTFWGEQGWTVVESDTADEVIAFNESPDVCVHDATSTWWYLYGGEWWEGAGDDFGARVSPVEQCTRDEMCAGCGMVVESNGHNWCCADQCDYGWIDFLNGECVCGH